MKLDFSQPYDFKKIEGGVYKKWEQSGYFNPDKLPPPRKKTFSIVIPPPNITGSLHMGHALNAVIQDIIIRKKRMEGFRALWLPGMDHAGIAAQNVVEKDLKKEGLSRHDLGREKFIERVWQWKNKYGGIILGQLKNLGSSLDWSRLKFTMDPDYQDAVADAFIHYYRKGWIYQGERTVNWCHRCATSISDLEIEYEPENSQLYYIKYGELVIATVRPETKLGDTAVAVNPKDRRYQNYIGKEMDIETVLGPAKIKVIADPEVDMKFGTGAIKVTPAHDIHDFELSQKYGLEKKQVIGPDGRMTKLAGKYAGLKVLEAREKIVEDMKKIGILVKIEPYRHNVAKCYRCGTVIEPILSKQWFLKMGELAKLAVGAVKSGQVNFHPKRWQKPCLEWLGNVRDWNISRQIWWGHRLPVWEHDKICLPKPGHEKDAEKCIEFIISKKEPKCKYCGAGYKQISDVLDTWFSSALWPFAVFGWPKKTKDFKKFYPTRVLSTARDIINLWVSRMIFSGLEFTGKFPFRDVIIHATILTKEGKRMSKSLGTGIDPMDLVKKWGADAVRFAIIWQSMSVQDMRWSEEALVAGKKFLNKIWNASRFVLSSIENSNKKSATQKPKPQTNADKKILANFEKTKKIMDRRMELYEFGPALRIFYDFFWRNFCDKYLEISKKQMKDSKLKSNTNLILIYVLFNSLKILHPFLPHITEAIAFENFRLKNKFLMTEPWPR